MKINISRNVEIKHTWMTSTEVDLILKNVERYPILGTAALICQEVRQPASLTILLDVVKLIDAVNPEHPQATFDSPTLASFMLYESQFTAEEYEILRDMLPDTRNLNVRVSGWGGAFSVAFDVSPKHGGHWQVTFSGKGSVAVPFDINVKVWANMDDIENHYEDCPDRLEDDEESEYECNCEPDVIHDETMKVEEWDEEIKEKIEKWMSSVTCS
jgi:hypothetical protein